MTIAPSYLKLCGDYGRKRESSPREIRPPLPLTYRENYGIYL